MLECFKIKYKFVVSIFLGMLLACADEYHQFYSLNRGPGLFDVGIDTLGVISGVILACVSIKLSQKVYNQWKRGKKVYDKFQENNCSQNCKNS